MGLRIDASDGALFRDIKPLTECSTPEAGSKVRARALASFLGAITGSPATEICPKARARYARVGDNCAAHVHEEKSGKFRLEQP